MDTILYYNSISRKKLTKPIDFIIKIIYNFFTKFFIRKCFNIMSGPELLKMIRKTYCYNLTISQLAEQIGISENTLAKAERGEISITSKLLRKLAGFYDIPLIPFTQIFYRLYEYNFCKPTDYQQAILMISYLLVNKKLPD